MQCGCSINILTPLRFGISVAVNKAKSTKPRRQLDYRSLNSNSLSSSLKLVRDKTHFHIDKKTVFDPKVVWQQADIKGLEFERLLRSTFETLNYLHRERWGDDFWLPDYDGTDACAIAKFSESLRYSKPSEFEALVGPPSADI